MTGGDRIKTRKKGKIAAYLDKGLNGILLVVGGLLPDNLLGVSLEDDALNKS